MFLPVLYASLFGRGLPLDAVITTVVVVPQLHDSREVLRTAQRQFVHAQIDLQMHVTQAVCDAAFVPAKLWAPFFTLPKAA